MMQFESKSRAQAGAKAELGIDNSIRPEMPGQVVEIVGSDGNGKLWQVLEVNSWVVMEMLDT